MTVYPDTFAPQVKWIPCVEKRRQSVLKDIVMYMMYYEFASRWLGTGVCPHLRRVVRTMVQHDSRKSDLSIVFHVRFSILLPLSNWRTHYVCWHIEANAPGPAQRFRPMVHGPRPHGPDWAMEFFGSNLHGGLFESLRVCPNSLILICTLIHTNPTFARSSIWDLDIADQNIPVTL